MTLIRPLQPGDVADVLRINAEGVPGVARLDPAELSRLMRISGLHLVAMTHGSVAGYSLAFSREHSYDGEEFLALRSSISEPFVYIDQVAIEGKARGTGIGRLLYQQLASRARDSGAEVLCCEVNTAPPNPVSLAFHQHLGFTPIREMTTADGRAVVLLRKPVDPSRASGTPPS